MYADRKSKYRSIHFSPLAPLWYYRGIFTHEGLPVNPCSVIIMAAGKGTRMKSDLPKVLHPLSGQPMLFYILQEAYKISDDVHVVIYHQAERVETAIKTRWPDATIVIQDHQRYPGTGGAVMAPKPKHQNVLVLNGDMPLVRAEQMKTLLETPGDVVMTAFSMDNPGGYGRVITENSQVLRIVEEKDATDQEKTVTLVNAGVYAFEHGFLQHSLPKLSNDNAQKEYYITDLVERAVVRGEAVRAVHVDEESFMGVNSKVELAKAEELYGRRLKEHWMRSGVIMHLPDTIYIEPTVTFEGECELEPGVVIKGNSRLVESSVKAHSVLEDAVLIRSSAGPMARVRPGSVLEESHIGNFVETKKARLTGVKAGHLSYLGDAEIGEGTNVGAGTITCNYDGKGKYKTTIGKNVFIGSDTQLVAPVTIADNVLIGAGSTITKDVEEGALALSRTPQTTKAGFFHRFFGTNKA